MNNRKRYSKVMILMLILIFLSTSVMPVQGSNNDINATGATVKGISHSGNLPASINNGTQISIDPELSITGITDDLEGASVVIDNFKNGDVLHFTDTAKINGVFNSQNGVLTLRGQANAVEYQSALRSVKFSTTSNDLVNRTISINLGTALYYDYSGHYYEFIEGTGIKWNDARVEAEDKRFFGRQGYLATITSEGENDFIKGKVSGIGWIGASDYYTELNRVLGTSYTKQVPDAEGQWYWVTGPEKGKQFWNGGIDGSRVNDQYVNWYAGEPNGYPQDSEGLTGEHYAHIIGPEGPFWAVPPDPSGFGKWNDFPNDFPDQVKGYIIEFGGMVGDEEDVTISTSIVLEVKDHTLIPQNSLINPTNSIFDKNVDNQLDLMITMTLNGNTFTGISNGGAPLLLGTDYTVDGTMVTIKKAYLAAQMAGSTNLTVEFSAGAIQNLTINVTDSTPPLLYTVTYNGNNNLSGTVPTDSNPYQLGVDVTVLGNTGNLARSGYTFAGWNTSANGSGIDFSEGTTFRMGDGNVTLYAKWTAIPSNPGSSDNSSDSNEPTQEIITVPVETGQVSKGTIVMQTPITRTTDQNGKITDDVILTPDRARDTVKFVRELGQNTARIVIPDEKDKVSKVIVNVPKEATKEVKENNINLEIYTENVRIAIPQQSLKTFEDDLYFRLIPMKEESERQEVEERAKKEEIIQEVAKNQTVKVLGRPMEIETNMQSREVSLVLPLKDSLPIDAKERQKMLDNLGIYVEHSDGTKELLRGKIVPYKNETELGLEFTVSKFSTFTIVYMEGTQAFFDGKTCGKDNAIGCVSAKKSVPLYEQVNNRLKKVDVLKSGKWDPAYEVISPMLGLGGDIWVERTDAILYETPSKEMLAKNAATGSSRIKQIWKGFEMHPGQIGKVTVLKDTVIWEKINKTKKLPRILKKGEQYRVYRYVPGMYNLGNGKYVVQDDYVMFKSLN